MSTAPNPAGPQRQESVKKRKKSCEETGESEEQSTIPEDTPLSAYFSMKDGSQLIKMWGISYQKDPASSVLELISLIFEIAGHRIEITKEHIESDSFESVLKDFESASNENGFTSPITAYIKDRSGKIDAFWSEMTQQFISCNLLFNPIYGDLQQWLVTLSSCMIRPVRQSASYAVLYLFSSLATSISHIDLSISRLTHCSEASSLNKNQLELHNKERTQYTTIIRNLERLATSVRIRDSEPSIRLLAVSRLTSAAISLPELFCTDANLSLICRLFNDPAAKNRQVGLRSFEDIITNLEDFSKLKSTISNYIIRIIEMCNDKDNSVVEAALSVLIALADKSAIGDVNLQSVYNLLADASQTIRSSAARFSVNQIFNSCLNDNEAQLTTLLKFVEQFDEEQLPSVVSSLYPKLSCLQDWQLLSDTLISSEVSARSQLISSILLYSAERTTGRLFNTDPEPEESIRSFSITLVNNLSRLIPAFQTEPPTLVNLIQTARLLNLNSVSECAADLLFPRLLSEIKNCFLNSSNKEVYTAASSVIYELSMGDHQLNEVARSELDHLAVGCSHLSEDSLESMGKFLAAAKYVNMSDNDTVRAALIRQIESSDEAMASSALECINYFFQWDVLKAKNGEKETFIPTLLKYRDLFNSKLTNGSILVKEAAIKGISNVISLSAFFGSCRDFFDDDLYDNFFRCFHRIFSKNEIFKDVSRPISWRLIPMEYSAHLLAYYGSEELRPMVTNLWSDIKSAAPLSGRLVVKALSEGQLSEDEKSNSAKYMSKRFKCYDIIESLSGSDGNSPHILQFVLQLKSTEASLLVEKASPSYREIITTIAKGERPTASMMNIFKPKAKSKLSLKLEEKKADDDEPEESLIQIVRE